MQICPGNGGRTGCDVAQVMPGQWQVKPSSDVTVALKMTSMPECAGNQQLLQGAWHHQSRVSCASAQA